MRFCPDCKTPRACRGGKECAMEKSAADMQRDAKHGEDTKADEKADARAMRVPPRSKRSTVL